MIKLYESFYNDAEIERDLDWDGLLRYYLNKYGVRFDADDLKNTDLFDVSCYKYYYLF